MITSWAPAEPSRSPSPGHGSTSARVTPPPGRRPAGGASPRREGPRARSPARPAAAPRPAPGAPTMGRPARPARRAGTVGRGHRAPGGPYRCRTRHRPPPDGPARPDGRGSDASGPVTRSSSSNVQPCEAFAHAVAGDGTPTVAHDRHPFAILGVAADRRLDTAHGRGHRALDQRQVGLADPARLELAHHRGLGCIVAGHDQQTRRVAVEPVDDAGPGNARDPSIVVVSREQRIDERPAPVSRAPDAPPARPACRRSADHRPRRRPEPRSSGLARDGTGPRAAEPRA